MNNKVSYFWNEELSKRDLGKIHPESFERIHSLHPNKIIQGLPIEVKSFQTESEEILYPIHDKEYIEFVKMAYKKKVHYLDKSETKVTENTFDQALLAASAGCAVIKDMALGHINRAFCAIRPPGHHANRYRALGFCIFNNVAVAASFAKYLLGVKRVLIVDWDVHPGNGTQEIFYEDGSIYTISFHEEGLLGPCGDPSLRGRGEGEGFNLNVPMAKNTAGEEYIRIFMNTINGIVPTFRPELCLISSGFDAHAQDSVASLKLQDDDYRILTEYLVDIVAPYTQNRIISFLEGGYFLSALRRSVRLHCQGLCKAPKI